MNAGTCIAGLYAITPDDSDPRALREKVRKALAGGARVVQYRNKSADRTLRSAQARSLLALCRESGIPLIINDDLELALEIGADGLHLGSDDGDLARARSVIGPERILGASCYNRLELAERSVAAGADYVAFGSVFDSPTKPAAVHASLALFAEARAKLSVPLVAIGGITLENARQVVEAGASAIAVISSLFEAADVEATARQFASLFPR
jgi:thiamine-phosphate pyrophosphorylase